MGILAKSFANASPVRDNLGYSCVNVPPGFLLVKVQQKYMKQSVTFVQLKKMLIYCSFFRHAFIISYFKHNKEDLISGFQSFRFNRSQKEFSILIFVLSFSMCY